MTHITDELEPCPFCGKADAFSERADFSSSYVVCNDCLARGPVECQDGDDEEEPGQASAIAAWNTRAMQSASPEGGSALREAVEAAWKEVRERLNREHAEKIISYRELKAGVNNAALIRDAALAPQEAAPDPAAVTADVTERPLLSEEPTNAGADHAPASATRDGSVAPEGQVTEALVDAIEPLALLAGGDVNMNDPLSKWFRVGHFYAAKDAMAAALTTTPAPADEDAERDR